MRFKKKKVTKHRGSKTHGGGAMKKRRGAGNRGGRGRAGSGKKGDAKKPSYWKEKTGKRGFSSKNRKKIRAINLDMIHKNLNSWLKKGIITKKAAGYEVELKKLGYDKLLGTGRVGEKLIIITNFASKRAVNKVRKAGGDVRVLQDKVVQEEEPEGERVEEKKEGEKIKEVREEEALAKGKTPERRN